MKHSVLPESMRWHAWRMAQLHVLQALKAGPGDWIHLKGLGLAHQVYPDPRDRKSSDVDILVDPEKLDNWVHWLDSTGFENQSPSSRPITMNQMLFVHRGTGVPLDLHWRIAYPHLPAPDFNVLWLDRSQINIKGVDVDVLSPAWGGLHLVMHAHQHLFEPRILKDFEYWLRHFQNVEEILELATSMGWRRVTTTCLEIVRLTEEPSNPGLDNPTFEQVLAEVIHEEWRSGHVLQDLSTQSGFYQILSVLLLDHNPLRRTLRYSLVGSHRVGTTIDRLRVALGRDPWEV
jgi:hypothetical protein